MYDHILLPTDGSEETEPAVEQAIDLADRYSASLHILYVVDKTALTPDMDVSLMYEELEEMGQSIVADLTDRAEQAGVTDAVGAVLYGAPHEEIIEYADEHGVDLIVMGTHGRTGLDRYILGSVAEKVVRLSEVSVLTTRLSQE